MTPSTPLRESFDNGKLTVSLRTVLVIPLTPSRALRDELPLCIPFGSVKNIAGGELASGIWEVRRLTFWMLLQRIVTFYVYRKLQKMFVVGMNLRVNIFSGSHIVLLHSGGELGLGLQSISLIALCRRLLLVVDSGCLLAFMVLAELYAEHYMDTRELQMLSTKRQFLNSFGSSLPSGDSIHFYVVSMPMKCRAGKLMKRETCELEAAQQT